MNGPSSASARVRMGVAAAAAIAVSALATGPVLAQPALPSYATGEESIRGRITSFDGKYQLQLRDERGFVDNVRLHDGTVINPTGLRLAPGLSVTVLGRNAGHTFDANQIDTPYSNYGAVPAYAYAYPVYGYPVYAYPAYGYPYRAYPAYGLGFRYGGFGFRSWF